MVLKLARKISIQYYFKVSCGTLKSFNLQQGEETNCIFGCVFLMLCSLQSIMVRSRTFVRKVIGIEILILPLRWLGDLKKVIQSLQKSFLDDKMCIMI